MKTRSLILAMAMLGLTGSAWADGSPMHTLQPSSNFAEKPGCNMYKSCGLIEPRVLGLTRSKQRRLKGMHDVLGTQGYRRGHTTFNVLDNIR